MFEMESTTPPVENPIPSIIRTVKIKVQPTTKPIPIRVTKKYTIFTSEDEEDDNNENEDLVSPTGDVHQAPETGNTVQHMIIQTMTDTGRNKVIMMPERMMRVCYQLP